MAEGVIIEGYGSGAKAWASEETQKQILGTLQKIGKLSDEQVKAIKAQAKKMETGSDSVVSASKNLANAMNSTEKELDEHREAIGKSTDTVEDFTTSLATSAKITAVALLGLAAKGVGAVMGASIGQMHMLMDLNRAGMNLVDNYDGVSNGILTFANAARTANLGFQELADLQQKYGKTLNIFGVQQFAQTSKEFRKLAHAAGALGMNADESAEFMAEYLDAQRIAGTLGTMSEQKRIEAAANAAAEFDDWSKALGVSKKELLEQANQLKDTPDIARFQREMAQKMGPEAADNLVNAMSNVFGPEMAAELGQVFASGAPTGEELFGDIARVSGTAAGQLMELYQAVNSGGIQSAEDLATAASGFMSTIENVSESQLRYMFDSGKAFSELQLKVVKQNQAIDQAEKERKQREDRVAKGMDPFINQISDFDSATREFKFLLERLTSDLFSNTKFLEIINNVFQEMAAIFKEVDGVSKFDTFVDAMGKLVKHIPPFVEKIVDSIIWFANWLSSGPEFSLTETLVKGITALFGAAYLIKSVGGAIGGMLLKVLGKSQLGKILVSELAEYVGGAFTGGGGLWGALKKFGAWGLIAGSVSEALSNIFNAKSIPDAIISGLLGIFTGAGNVLMSTIGGIFSFFGNDSISNWWDEKRSDLKGSVDYFFGGNQPKEKEVSTVANNKSNNVNGQKTTNPTAATVATATTNDPYAQINNLLAVGQEQVNLLSQLLEKQSGMALSLKNIHNNTREIG